MEPHSESVTARYAPESHGNTWRLRSVSAVACWSGSNSAFAQHRLLPFIRRHPHPPISRPSERISVAKEADDHRGDQRERARGPLILGGRCFFVRPAFASGVTRKFSRKARGGRSVTSSAGPRDSFLPSNRPKRARDPAAGRWPLLLCFLTTVFEDSVGGWRPRKTIWLEGRQLSRRPGSLE